MSKKVEERLCWAHCENDDPRVPSGDSCPLCALEERIIDLERQLHAQQLALGREHEARVNLERVVEMRAGGLTIAALVERSGRTAREKGWENMTPELFLTWAHSELSEIFTHLRCGAAPNATWKDDGKPEGAPVDVADVFILLSHFMFEAYNLDPDAVPGIEFEKVVEEKLQYNDTRPKNHGHKMTHLGVTTGRGGE